MSLFQSAEALIYERQV